MSSTTTSWILQLVDKITSPLGTVQKGADGAADAIEKATKKTATFSELLHKLKPIDWLAVRQGIDTIDSNIRGLVEVGAKYDASLRDVSAITGVTGRELEKLGTQARQLAKDFGSSASDNLGTFQTILSRLGPQIGENAEALGNMGKYANTLSKTMGGDVKGATDALTTSMLQFQVSLDDPKQAAEEMESMMNIMAAGAKFGSAEVTQVGETLREAGVYAKLSGLSFAETNAAIQKLGDGGLYGSMAGTSMKNMLVAMAGPSETATKYLEAYGIKVSEISDATIPFADRLKKLGPIQHDINALNEIFGRQAGAAAQVLIRTAGEQENLTKEISNTSVAYEQAQTVMEGWTEKISRAKAWIDDLKIGTFSLTSVLSIATGAAGGMLAGLADISMVYTGLGPVLRASVGWLKSWSVVAGIAKVVTAAWTAVQWALNAAFVASPVGWVALGIGALAAVIALAWNKCEGFRNVIYGLWEVLKGFGNIIKDFVIDRITGLLSGIGKLGEALVSLFRGDFKGAGQSALQGVRGVTGFDAFKNAGNAVAERYGKGVDGSKRQTAQKKAKEEKESAGNGSSKTLRPGAIEPGKIPAKKYSPGDKKEKSMNLSGGGSGKSVTMNVTLNITNHGVSDPNKFTEQVVRTINDRLNDSLAAIA